MKIQKCRLCQSTDIVTVINLGDFAFSGVFPLDISEPVLSGNLTLLLCIHCSLLQLEESFPREELYGENYGYRSGLNNSMVSHLANVVSKLKQAVQLTRGDLVLDIASNDGTLLRNYDGDLYGKFGVDPTSRKFREFYDNSTNVISDFFPSKQLQLELANRKVKIITSIAMLYDLENPLEFASEIREILSSDGVWYFEQSYMPWMIKSGAYDTICHEHIEYYSLTSISFLLKEAGFFISDVELNDINGGSIAVTARIGNFNESFKNPYVAWLLKEEENQDLFTPSTFITFLERIKRNRSSLQNLLTEIQKSGSRIGALGASTKGSILLQYSGIDSSMVEFIGDVNPYKFGRVMAGSGIPIISEEEALLSDVTYYLVLPWHFKETFRSLGRSSGFAGKKLIFPLPEIEVYFG